MYMQGIQTIDSISDEIIYVCLLIGIEKNEFQFESNIVHSSESAERRFTVHLGTDFGIASTCVREQLTEKAMPAENN